MRKAKKTRPKKATKATKAPKAAAPPARVNYFTWNAWLREVIALLGHLPKHRGVTDEQHLFGELGVDNSRAQFAYNANCSPSTFVDANPQYLAANASRRGDPLIPDFTKTTTLSTRTVRDRLLKFVAACQTGTLDTMSNYELRSIVGAIKAQADRWYETVCGRPVSDTFYGELPLETWRDVVVQLTMFRNMLRAAKQPAAAVDQVTRTIDALRAVPGLWERLAAAGLVRDKERIDGGEN